MNGMMLAFCPQEKDRLHDRCIHNSNCVGIGDDLDLPVVELCRNLEIAGVECHTYDMLPLDRFSGFVFFEMPKEDDAILLHAKRHSAATFLLIAENHFILPRNADFNRYSEFTAVFTYNDDAVARGLAHKINYALSLSQPPEDGVTFDDRKLAVMISSRVKKNRPHLCSYLRIQAARFYETCHPESFDLYGPGWDKGTFLFQENPRVYRWISLFKLNKLFPRHKYRHCWRGTVDRKRQVLGKYRFSYCYENTVEIPGYITEKIFDVMMAGSVPIYLGHPSTVKYIPKSCYIDRADFKDDVELYTFISSMKEDAWRKYLDAVRDFLSGAANGPFSIPAYVKTLCDVIVPAMIHKRSISRERGA